MEEVVGDIRRRRENGMNAGVMPEVGRLKKERLRLPRENCLK